MTPYALILFAVVIAYAKLDLRIVAGVAVVLYGLIKLTDIYADFLDGILGGLL